MAEEEHEEGGEEEEEEEVGLEPTVVIRFLLRFLGARVPGDEGEEQQKQEKQEQEQEQEEREEDSPRERAGTMLWDMSCSPDAAALMQHGAAGICSEVLRALPSDDEEEEAASGDPHVPVTTPRMAELACGILANLSGRPEFCTTLAQDAVSIQAVADVYLQSDDPNVLREATRCMAALIYASCSLAEAAAGAEEPPTLVLWVVLTVKPVLDKSAFVLASTTDAGLLARTADLLSLVAAHGPSLSLDPPPAPGDSASAETPDAHPGGGEARVQGSSGDSDGSAPDSPTLFSELCRRSDLVGPTVDLLQGEQAGEIAAVHPSEGGEGLAHVLSLLEALQGLPDHPLAGERCRDLAEVLQAMVTDRDHPPTLLARAALLLDSLATPGPQSCGKSLTQEQRAQYDACLKAMECSDLVEALVALVQDLLRLHDHEAAADDTATDDAGSPSAAAEDSAEVLCVLARLMERLQPPLDPEIEGALAGFSSTLERVQRLGLTIPQYFDSGQGNKDGAPNERKRCATDAGLSDHREENHLSCPTTGP